MPLAPRCRGAPAGKARAPHPCGRGCNCYVTWAWPGSPPGRAEGRYRLYERVGETLRESAKDQPHLLVIDDLHRADEASLRLLAYLSETLWPAPIGLVVAYRDTEVPPASLTANVVAGLARGPGRRRCELAGLSQASVARWLAAAGLDGVDPADLYARTGGTRCSSRKASSSSPTDPGLTPRCAA